VHAGLLDVLHHRGHEGLSAIGNRVDVELDRSLEEAVDQHGARRARRGGRMEISGHLCFGVHNLHGSPAEHIGRSNHDRVSDPFRHSNRFGLTGRFTVRRGGERQRREHGAELPPVLCSVDGSGRCAQDTESFRLELRGEPKRRLAAELNDHSLGFLCLAYGQDVFNGERLEVQPIARVVVGGNRFRIAVHHHGLVARFVQGERGVDAREIELDALSDPIRSRSENDDPRPVGGTELRGRLVGREVIGSLGGELSRAGIHRLEHGDHTRRPPGRPDVPFS
jgi:hypothetical protein